MQKVETQALRNSKMPPALHFQPTTPRDESWENDPFPAFLPKDTKYIASDFE